MSIKYNSNDIKKIYYNGNEVKKVIYNNIEVYSSSPLSFDINISTYTLNQVIEIADLNLRSKYNIVGKYVISLQNSRYTNNAIIVDVTSSAITIMTTSKIDQNRWSNRSTVVTNFKNGFNSSVSSKIKDCFIPSKDQLDGGWNYMTDASRRALGFQYWTDTPNSDPVYFDHVWYVGSYGDFYTCNHRGYNYWFVAGFTV